MIIVTRRLGLRPLTTTFKLNAIARSPTSRNLERPIYSYPLSSDIICAYMTFRTVGPKRKHPASAQRQALWYVSKIVPGLMEGLVYQITCLNKRYR